MIRLSALCILLFLPVDSFGAEETEPPTKHKKVVFYKTLLEFFKEGWDVQEVRGQNSIVTVQTNQYKVDRPTYLSMIKKFCEFSGTEEDLIQTHRIRALEITNNLNKQGWSFTHLENCTELVSLKGPDADRVIMDNSIMILGNIGGIFMKEFTQPKPNPTPSPKYAKKGESQKGKPPSSPKRTCKDFKTQAEAQQFFIQSGGPKKDPFGLDEDKDGIACEELPWK